MDTKLKTCLVFSILLALFFLPVGFAMQMGYSVGRNGPMGPDGKPFTRYIFYVPLAIANAALGWFAIYHFFWS